MTEAKARRFARHLAIIRGLQGEDLKDAEQEGAISHFLASGRHDGYQNQAISNGVTDLVRLRLQRKIHMEKQWEDIFEPIDPFDAYRKVDDRAAFRWLVNRVMDRCRREDKDMVKVLLLELTDEESAAILGISVPAFKARLHRNRKLWNEVLRKTVT